MLVGGFLGAGKTTLLLRAAADLRQAGVRVALITNDQGGALVDTKLAASSGIDTQEIAGGCFCCRLSDFTAAAERLLLHGPEVIFAEPVGSCIDISATVLQPVKAFWADRFRLAPFTVLVDPSRARELLVPDADPSLAYLFRNQIAEADLVCAAKSDLYQATPGMHEIAAMRLSARTGEGVSQWLREVLAGNHIAGGRVLDVDYDRYADAEAALGWLNWHGTVRVRPGVSPALLVGPLLEDIDQQLIDAGVEIAHLKILDGTESGFVKAAISRNGEEPSVEGALDASPAERHEIVINLRACASPQLLEAVVRQVTAKLPGTLATVHLECFRPARPNPERRIAQPLRAQARAPGRG